MSSIYQQLREKSAVEIGRLLAEKKLGTAETAQAFMDRISDGNPQINAVITETRSLAMKQAEAAQDRINRGENDSPLCGVPLLVKDNICVDGVRTTAASAMLEDFVPPYDATVIKRLKEAGAVMVGKTNLDEFAMGGSTETSFFGSTKNPWDHNRVPGGSSGGSAAGVAAGFAPYALGSDTGGSIRQPCSFCGLTGIKPTYGSVSRYGLLAYASSLDQIGPMGTDVDSCAEALSLISGRDPLDSTSVMERPYDFRTDVMGANPVSHGLKDLRIGLPVNFFELGLTDEVRSTVLRAADELARLGASVEEFEMPVIEYAVPAYYIVACAEASSNLSRYDGIKYGHRSGKASTLTETYYRSREEGFGPEVKRRIMLGSFVLSSGYFDAYYKKALQARALVKQSFDQAFRRFDAVLSPVSPTAAYEIGGQIADPVAMYMADIYTVAVNLAGLPAVSLPCGFTGQGLQDKRSGEGAQGGQSDHSASSGQGLPVGFQLIGKAFSEPLLVQAARTYQNVTDYHKKRPDDREASGAGKGGTL